MSVKQVITEKLTGGVPEGGGCAPIQGALTEGGSISIIHLLIKVACFVTNETNILNIKMS
jgi:hypothetical protein